MLVHGEGPIPAKIMIVGEAPGFEEDLSGHPFVGQSGKELDRMLHEAGILRTECFVTNVIRQRPPNNDITKFIPDRKANISPLMMQFKGKSVSSIVVDGYEMLKKEIAAVKPNLIIALGNTALWALTGNSGIVSWRGSVIESDIWLDRHDLGTPDERVKVMPAYHPAAILRQWDWRFITVQDFRRAKVESEFPEIRYPKWEFEIRPSYDMVMSALQVLLDRADKESFWLAVDVETRKGHIDCVGLAWSKLQAICIPFLQYGDVKEYWNETQEIEIVIRLRRLLAHPNVKVIGQNFLYDTQYFISDFKVVPNLTWDTMVAHHCCFPGMPKGLDFLSSMYCDFHQYWKDDLKEADMKVDNNQRWTYNCRDAVVTYEVCAIEQHTVRSFGKGPQNEFQQWLFWPCLNAMLKGVATDSKKRVELSAELAEAYRLRETWLESTLGHKLNPRSPKQMHALIYNDFNQKIILNRKTRRPTLDDEAMQRIGEREPLLQPLCNIIADMRTLGVFRSTFIESEMDPDGRMRCSFNPAGPETFRLSSSENAFGRGMNLQNVPSDKSKSINKARDRGSHLELPNVRTVFVPDVGYTFWDMDLDRADLQVVVWESNDEELKAALRMGADLHLMNACALQNLPTPPLDELVETHPKYKEHRQRLSGPREFAKTFIHGTNYGGSARTMAAHANITVHQAELFQRRWFDAHKGIADWHERTLDKIMSTRSVENAFGYRRFYFGRVEGLLPEALAWVPQSTVACVINRAWLRISLELPEVDVLLQVHDSIAGQYPTDKPHLPEAILSCGLVEIPYDDPLTIPVGIKLSNESWGACK